MMDARTTKAKDPNYFLQWEFVTFQVEDTLFRIPSFHLLRQSYDLNERFKSRFAAGISKETPVFIGGGITANEFRHFLQIILPSVTEDPADEGSKSIPSKLQWLSVLKISTSLRCPSLRKLAIDKLENKPPTRFASNLTLTEKVLYGRRYHVSRWVEAGYVALVKQGTLTDMDIEGLGAVASSKLLQILLDDVKQPFQSPALENRVKSDFEQELQAITEIERNYRVPPKFGLPRSLLHPG